MKPMWIERLSLHHYRNVNARLELGAGLNVLLGRNGQGKTNVLESIFVSCYGKSFRSGRLGDLVQFDQEQAQVLLSVSHDGLSTDIETVISAAQRSQKVGGKENSTALEVSNALKVVFFGPEELSLVKGGPVLRREFLDRAIVVHHPPFGELQRRYGRILKERNQLLKEFEGYRGPPVELMEAYEEELGRYGAQIVESRRRYLREFVPYAREFLRQHTAGALELEVTYLGNPVLESGNLPEGRDLAKIYQEALKQGRGRDSATGSTSIGPHLDDLEITVNGRPARFFASQGEQRQIVVSCKLAQLALWKERFQVLPVLLLDDVSSELDAGRTQLLFGLIQTWGIQTILTTTSMPDVLLGQPGTRVFQVESGVVQPDYPKLAGGQ